MGLLSASFKGADELFSAADDLATGGDEGAGFLSGLTAEKVGKAGIASGVTLGSFSLGSDYLDVQEQQAEANTEEAQSNQSMSKTEQQILSDDSLTFNEKMAALTQLEKAQNSNSNSNSNDSENQDQSLVDEFFAGMNPMTLIIGVVIVALVLKYALATPV